MAYCQVPIAAEEELSIGGERLRKSGQYFSDEACIFEKSLLFTRIGMDGAKRNLNSINEGKKRLLLTL